MNNGKKSGRDSFDEIYRDYFRDVFLYLMSLTHDEHAAEDLTQEVFFRAMKSLNRFRGDCQVRVWMCQIARNEYFRYCKKIGRTASCDADSFADSEAFVSGTVRFEERLEDGETAFDLHRMLHALEEPYKEVFWLRTFGELSFRKIAELFGRSESWARVTYHRARLKIIDMMNQSGGNGNEQN